MHHAFATYYQISSNLKKAAFPQFKSSSVSLSSFTIVGELMAGNLFVATTPVVAFRYSPQQQSLEDEISKCSLPVI